MIIGSFVYYITIDFIAKRQLDQNLEMQLREAEEFLNTTNKFPQDFDADHDHAVFHPLNPGQHVVKRFFDTTYNNPVTKKGEPGRAVESAVSNKNNKFKVTVTISRIGNLELVKMISTVTALLATLMLFLQFVTSKYLFIGLWKTFSQILKEIKDLNLEEARVFKKMHTSVDEFSELNQALYEMSVKWSKDYLALKNFSENASHEMMTPLAVITGKLDQLIQGENLTAAQLELIGDIYSSVDRSTRLNQSLILLTKIENNLHPENEQLDLREIVSLKITQFDALIKENDLTIIQNLHDVQIFANKLLIDLMLNNFLTNAIWHNKQGGNIYITLSPSELVLANHGSPVELEEAKMFDRFRKGRSSQGMGLGLTLINNICRHYNFRLSYRFSRELHVFIVSFAPSCKS